MGGITPRGQDCSKVQAHLVDVQHIYATSDAFAALKADGAVVAWGSDSDEAEKLNPPNLTLLDGLRIVLDTLGCFGTFPFN